MSTADGSENAPEPVLPDLYPEADRQLVQACVHGEPAAWDAFVDRFAGLLAFVVDRTAAQRQVRLAPADRDDLLADVVMEMVHNDAAVLRGFAGRSSLATYLCVVARRVAVRGLTRLAEKRKARPLETSTEPGHSDQGPARVADREQVESLLGQLDDEEAMLVRLHHLESRSYGEISRLTGMPLGSIGPTLARARQKMRLKPGEVPVQAGAGGQPLPPDAGPTDGSARSTGW
jgi:RNA polymerase sigma-70 factor (ECF subfamily)